MEVSNTEESHLSIKGRNGPNINCQQLKIANGYMEIHRLRWGHSIKKDNPKNTERNWPMGKIYSSHRERGSLRKKTQRRRKKRSQPLQTLIRGGGKESHDFQKHYPRGKLMRKTSGGCSNLKSGRNASRGLSEKKQRE